MFVFDTAQGAPLLTICPTGTLNSYELEDPEQVVAAIRTRGLDDAEQHLPPVSEPPFAGLIFSSFFCIIRKSSFFRPPHSPALLSIHPTTEHTN